MPVIANLNSLRSSNGRPAMIVVSELAPEVARRTWSIAAGGEQARCRLYFVRNGNAIFEAGEPLALASPSLLWLPQPATGSFHLEAGSEGFAATIPAELIRRLTGDTSLAVHLRSLLDGMVVLAAARVAPLVAEISISLSVLERETREPRPGSAAMIAAHLNLILLHLWRGSGEGIAANVRGTGTTTAQRFAQLVEIHYREQVSIDGYAAMLGVTRAHLHESSKRALCRTPLALVHERLIGEAKSRIDQTDLPIEQIAFSLGFQDAAYFNRFFRRLTGLTPGNYRSLQTNSATKRANNISYADWP